VENPFWKEVETECEQSADDTQNGFQMEGNQEKTTKMPAWANKQCGNGGQRDK
jgi:hypothetical protein